MIIWPDKSDPNSANLLNLVKKRTKNNDRNIFEKFRFKFFFEKISLCKNTIKNK